MENHRLKLLLQLLMLSFLLSACGTWSPATPGPLIPGLAQTLAAQTLTAQQGSQLAGYSSVASQSPFEVELSAEILPTSTPAPVETLVPLLTPAQKNAVVVEALQTPDQCTNAAEFVQDVSIPDNSVMRGGERFVKTWRFKNIGTCTWTPDYALVFAWGAQMGGASPKPLGKTVAPGEYVDISVEMKAPKESGNFQGSWFLQDAEGKEFGTGYKAKNFFWVAIVIRGKFDGFARSEGGCVAGG